MATTLASAPGEIDPALEIATLDELNEALTRAFAQIANRHAQGSIASTNLPPSHLLGLA
jgi:hypothetical protein